MVQAAFSAGCARENVASPDFAHGSDTRLYLRRTTLADVAATSLSAVRTLERHGLDYSCAWKQPFEEACLVKGLKPESVMREIEQALVPGESGRDWQTVPL